MSPSERLRAVGDRELLARLRPRILEDARRGARVQATLHDDGQLLFLKGEALTGRARWRHALRGVFLRSDLPRLREYANLGWLRAHGFGAPEPLAAGAVTRMGVAIYQFLVTRWIEGAPTLADVLAEGIVELRRDALAELAVELARLHAAGFVHRDVFARNLLVSGRSGAVCIHLLDAWRGGPGPSLRGPDYDVACFLHDAARHTSPDERRDFLDAYVRARLAAGDALAADEFRSRVERERRGLAARLQRRARRRAARP